MAVLQITKERLYVSGFDLVRPVAAFSVVWIHGCETSFWTKRLNGLNEYAVPVFIAISFFLFAGQVLSGRLQSFGEMAAVRFKRLMVPFFLWTLVYLGIRYAKAAYLHTPFEVSWMETFLFRGSSYQLWYLPNLFYLFLLFFPFLKVAKQHVRKANLTLATVIIIALVIIFSNNERITQADWFTRHVRLYFVPSLVSASIGMLYYINYDMLKERYDKAARILTPLLVLVLFVAQYFIPHLVVSLLFITVLFAWLLFQVRMENSFIKRLSANSMGIYLVHGIFLEGIKTGMNIVGHPVSGFAQTVGLIVGVYALSFLASEILSGNSFLRKYFMGN
ncbi:acyltransferase family protein [Chitinophaga japonensis]|uniref:Peptidoglycan/LPS O-acetylase OafA/YrhL n=1 Tax=Chitinophaga japonensis TaxID=104662 RepID=A0A562T658_CHIJA|nr:acyltransferase [Chitinophaga japonensis]TWI88734.1 peptidoglycan/LPS O-acetylase OafA/YrhL [Chitinophaga japonensis]